MATAAQLTKQMGEMISPTTYRQRMSAKKRRKQIIDAQVSALQRAIEDIRKKARETPAWANGYHSAITSIELQIQLLSKT